MHVQLVKPQQSMKRIKSRWEPHHRPFRCLSSTAAVAPVPCGPSRKSGGSGFFGGKLHIP